MPITIIDRNILRSPPDAFEKQPRRNTTALSTPPICRYSVCMFGKGQREELLQELAWLRGRIAALEAERDRGLRLDTVTGLLSARSFRGRLSEEVDRARRYQRPLSVAMVAIDDFAALELMHGFKAGDELLASVARLLSGATRGHDL